MPVKCCPPFPEAAWGELLRPFKRRPTVKRRSFSEDTAMTGSPRGKTDENIPALSLKPLDSSKG